MKNIAIISARSGTKGLPDKNIRLLNEKPLIAYSIEVALESGYFEEIMLSTDSEKYAEIGRRYGAKVPFLRSQKTASDSASSWIQLRKFWTGIWIREENLKLFVFFNRLHH